MSFARLMERALYDPAHGYYSRSADGIGPRGDYVTAADAGRDFGRAFARQVAEVATLFEPYDSLDIVEFGAGRGLLARDVLDGLREEQPQLARRVSYRSIDRSAAMRERARHEAPEAEVLAPEQLPGGLRGLGIAVELFDALPVHRVRRRQGELVEIRVGLDPASDGLVEVEAPAARELQEWAMRYGAAAAEGAEAELCLEAGLLLQSMARSFERGVLAVVDYGDRAERLYGPASSAGTLLAYHRQQTSTAYLERIGEQDLTAHVNFTALEDSARAAGLAVLGRTTLDRFLIAHGILEAFEHGSDWADARRVRRRMRALQLLHPGAMGRRFKVLLVAKGLAEPLPALRGLVDPFAR